MGLLDLLEDEFLEVSSRRATLRELVELLAGSVLFVAIAAGLSWYLLSRTVALAVAGVLALIFAITIGSQAYWAWVGRDDYAD